MIYHTDHVEINLLYVNLSDFFSCHCQLHAVWWLVPSLWTSPKYESHIIARPRERRMQESLFWVQNIIDILRFVHYIDVIINTMESQITSLTIVYSTVFPGADQRKHQSSASLAFVRGIHRWPVDSPHKGPVTWKMVSFDDVIMITEIAETQIGRNITNIFEETNLSGIGIKIRYISFTEIQFVVRKISFSQIRQALVNRPLPDYCLRFGFVSGCFNSCQSGSLQQAIKCCEGDQYDYLSISVNPFYDSKLWLKASKDFLLDTKEKNLRLFLVTYIYFFQTNVFAIVVYNGKPWILCFVNFIYIYGDLRFAWFKFCPRANFVYWPGANLPIVRYRCEETNPPKQGNWRVGDRLKSLKHSLFNACNAIYMWRNMFVLHCSDSEVNMVVTDGLVPNVRNHHDVVGRQAIHCKHPPHPHPHPHPPTPPPPPPPPTPTPQTRCCIAMLSVYWSCK